MKGEGFGHVPEVPVSRVCNLFDALECLVLLPRGKFHGGNSHGNVLGSLDGCEACWVALDLAEGLGVEV